MYKFLFGRFAALTMCFGAAFLTPAQSAPVLVELFTSLGCSSCPPADANLQRLSKQDGVVVLSYHVDYWNYLGWEDQFSKPEFTRRQRQYAAAHDTSSLFTPQAIVSGQSSIVGSNFAALDTAIEAHRARAPEVRIVRNGEGLALTGGAFARPVHVWLAEIIAEQTVDIEGGENAGRQVTNVNIVRRLTKIGDWDGGTAFSLHSVDYLNAPAVIFIQAPGFGEVFAAFKLGGDR